MTLNVIYIVSISRIKFTEIFINKFDLHLNMIYIHFNCTFSHHVFVKCPHLGSICNKRWKFNYEDIAITMTRVDELKIQHNMIAIVTQIFTYIFLTVDVYYSCEFHNDLLTHINRKFMVEPLYYFTSFYKYCCYLFIW